MKRSFLSFPRLSRYNSDTCSSFGPRTLSCFNAVKRRQFGGSQREARPSASTHYNQQPMYPYALTVAYMGSQYSGNAFTRTADDSVSHHLCHAFADVFQVQYDSGGGNRFALKWTSRTDKGVHSLHNVVAVRLPVEHNAFCEHKPFREELLSDINAQLPFDIEVSSITAVPFGTCKNLLKRPRGFVNYRKYHYICPSFVFADSRSLNLNPWLPAATGSEVVNPFWDEANFHLGTPQFVEAVNGYRMSEAQQSELNALLSRFVGETHVHNFTKGNNLGDGMQNSGDIVGLCDYSTRGIHSCEVHSVFTAASGGMQWLRLEIVGHSFVYHQIRKLLGYAFCCQKQVLIPLPLATKQAFDYGFAHPFYHLSSPLPKVPSDGLCLKRTAMNDSKLRGDLLRTAQSLNATIGENQNEYTVSLSPTAQKDFEQMTEACIVKNETETNAFQVFVARMFRKMYGPKIAQVLRHRSDDNSDDGSVEKRSADIGFGAEIKPVLSDIKSLLRESPIFKGNKRQLECAFRKLRKHNSVPFVVDQSVGEQSGSQSVAKQRLLDLEQLSECFDGRIAAEGEKRPQETVDILSQIENLSSIVDEVFEQNKTPKKLK